jgi:DNA-binding response OmpR family regulator
MPHKILTVDDSRTIRMIVKKALTPYEVEVLEAENGMDGLELAIKEKPDLIILDITMPVMTGVEMLHKLKAVDALKNIPVIMLTAESGKDNVMQIVKMGVKDYMVKPFRGEQLVDRVGTVLTLEEKLIKPSESEESSEIGFFRAKGDVVILTLPEKITRNVGMQIESALKEKSAQMNVAGTRKMILDIGRVKDFGMTTIQLIISIINSGIRTKLQMRMTASDTQKEAMKGFHETTSISTWPSIEQAIADF